MLQKLLDFLQGNQVAVILGCLWAMSEGLAQIPSVEANSVFQAIHNGLKWLKDKLSPAPKV